MATPATTLNAQRPPAPASAETRFVNAMRLGGPQWLAAAIILASFLLAIPSVWKKIERFDTGPDYRIPYSLSKDYWLYERRLEGTLPTNVVVLGDSVIWGEYVRRDGTFTHFLNQQSGQPGEFVNAGVNGLFPLALEGLIRYYGTTLHDRRIILHCNLLWMSSPKADLQTEKEERFNHADLVPQFFPRVPCYKADLNHRLTAVVQRHFTFSEWASHLQIAYFGQKNVLGWTLEEEGGNPFRLPNAYKNPLAQITLAVPPEPAEDPERGPASPRHKPWSTTGQGSTRFEWVELNRSMQWRAFQRLVALLQARRNNLFVLLGPFNEHIMAEENRPRFRELRAGVSQWLASHRIAHLAAEALPSELYADASHPLTDGYERLARQVWDGSEFQRFINRSDTPDR